METILYIIAAILVIGWAVGFFANSASNIIQVLLVIAAMTILFRVKSGSRMRM